MQPDEGRGRTGLSPIAAFGILIAVVAAIVAVVLLTRPDSPDTPGAAPPTEPDYSLTDAEAIARFKELDALRIQAYEIRDTSLLASVFLDNASFARRVHKEIVQLRRDNVLSRTRFHTESLHVDVNEPERLVILQEVLLEPKFLSESGKNVTGKQGPQRQTIRWILVPEGSVWQIKDALVIDSDPA